ncbi:hypothetical protein BJY04DRAFT_202916 [Aspergillus karnatakaensis]|uniref:uncharacterized protein n=1 Tax=Aspergillus karnatakaensis TaxID=1810916 RepID=UPI003CCDEB30
MVNLLLEHGVRVNDSNAIVKVNIKENLEMATCLLLKGADINEIGIEGPPGNECYSAMESPLHQAATERYTEMAPF